MRKYVNQNDRQQKSYYNDRFYVSPEIVKESVDIDEVFNSDLSKLKENFTINESYISKGTLVLIINSNDNKNILEYLKNELEYDMLMELSAVDYISKLNSFEIFYELLSMSKRKRVRVKCSIQNGEAIESVEPLFRSADWSEREMYDMFGIVANNHPYMKRILMPDDWSGHPLLKTYPLQGDEAASWYEVDKIFGKEARDTIGPEIRDSSTIDRYDTKRFARLGHEVPYGTDISKGEPDTPLAYQEEEGVFLIQKLDEKESVTLKTRK